MEFVTLIVTPVVESLLVPVKRHFGFMVFASKNVRDMHSKVKELDGAAHDMNAQQVSCKVNSRVVPHRVPYWLEESEKIKARATKIPTVGVGCFNIKTRYKAGKGSSDILKDIDRLMKEKADMVWTNEIIPLGAITPPRPSTSTTVHHDDRNKNIVKSRELIFNAALKSLESNNTKTQKIALCGMSGVGKTTMMEDLEKAAIDRKMFDSIVKVSVWQNPNPVVVQQTVAEYTGETLTETTKDTRAERLKKRFQEMLVQGKKKILVILDDVWEEFNVKDIGLESPLPTEFKLLLTSREETICTQMGVDTSSLFRIVVLKKIEAKKLFWDTLGLVSDSEIEPDMSQIGEDILRRCGGLPIAIKTIASTLKDNEEKDEWKDALFCIQNKNFPILINIFEFSYENLKEDDLKATFLLSGLFPEDYNIRIEDLVMYGWGLKFHKYVCNIAIARSRVKTCVNKLIRSNLLTKSDYEGCVKMHDLVRDFVLSSFSKVKQASIMNHNNFSEQLKEVESYERILLQCKGMFDFPVDFIHLNLAFLKLMDGEKLLKFPVDFYIRMEKLKVAAYENMHRPLLPQYSTNLRALFLRSCSLMDDDISFLGDLINLEALSLTYCGIQKLPSKIGKLKRLKLLDLTNCANLCIDDGVFQNLDKLEELYMRVCEGRSIRFTDASCKELKMLSAKLSALELEFFYNKTQPSDVSFRNLERFRISMGCFLKMNMEMKEYPFKNTLKLVTTSSELHKSKINELFSKTEVLHLEVNDMSSLEDYLMHPQYSFCNLKELFISDCKGLSYLFAIPVAKGLMNLETLRVTQCPILKSVVNGENSEVEVITFHKLRRLYLHNLPELVSLCGHGNITNIPQLKDLDLNGLPNITSIFPANNVTNSAMQPFFNKEVAIPKLKYLDIHDMMNLQAI